MSHQVAGYPDDETCLAVGEALIAGGAKILEVQLAFSDPSADGVAIQTACSTVLARKYTVTRNGLHGRNAPPPSGNSDFHYDLCRASLSSWC